MKESAVVQRSNSVGTVALALMAWLFFVPAQAQAAGKNITVYKSATCECCNDWITHLRQSGYTVKAHNRTDMNSIKQLYGVTGPLKSCHTAFVEGYVVEGHVPARDIDRLLKLKPSVMGLTAPGMPKKSPGMQAAYLPPKDYDVLSFDERGQSRIFSHY